MNHSKSIITMYYKRLIILYWLSALLIFISCSNEKRSPKNIVNYDLEDIRDEKYLLSNIADSIIYYPISCTDDNTTNYLKRVDIQLTNDYIFITHLRIGQLYNRHTGEC